MTTPLDVLWAQYHTYRKTPEFQPWLHALGQVLMDRVRLSRLSTHVLSDLCTMFAMEPQHETVYHQLREVIEQKAKSDVMTGSWHEQAPGYDVNDPANARCPMETHDYPASQPTHAPAAAPFGF